MRSRPYDWTALGLDADPVPGDPDVVSAESRRLGQTAQELRAQIALLKQISQDTTLKGQYAGTLRWPLDAGIVSSEFGARWG